MKTAIIVPTYDRPNLVTRMLESLSKCELTEEIQVLIVENGKRTNVEEICKLKNLNGSVQYHFLEKSGRSIALNYGIKKSDAEFFIFFDDDLTFVPNIITSYVDAAKKLGHGHFFGGPLIADAESPCAPHLFPHLPSSCKDWAMPANKQVLSLTDETMFFGANWAGFRQDIEEAGGFPENIGVSKAKFSPVGEETVLQQNMLKVGKRGIYLQDATIYHLVPKECYTEKWIRNRKVRHGVTDYILDMQQNNDIRKFLGVPTWVLLALVQESAKLIKASFCSSSLQERTAINMRISYLFGMFSGRFRYRGN